MLQYNRYGIGHEHVEYYDEDMREKKPNILSKSIKKYTFEIIATIGLILLFVYMVL